MSSACMQNQTHSFLNITYNHLRWHIAVQAGREEAWKRTPTEGTPTDFKRSP